MDPTPYRYTVSFKATSLDLSVEELVARVPARGWPWEIIALSVQPTQTPGPPARIDQTGWRLFVSDDRPSNLLYTAVTPGWGRLNLDPNQLIRIEPYEELIIGAIADDSFDTLTGAHGAIFGRITLEERR